MLPTLNTVSADLDAGRATSVGLTEAALVRAADPQGEGARVFTRLDRDAALASAQASDRLRAAGLARSPLEGVPISVKDLFDIAGQPTPAGSTLLSKAPIAERTAVVVERLRAAGAVIMGRTNMTEFAYSGLGINPHYGTPRNAWDRATGRIPGGSSSGAAVSVTDGMAFAAIGSDTGGSVRIPSALCGLTGFKPTANRVPMDGVLPLSKALDSIGPLAASVECCAILDAIMAGERYTPIAPKPLETCTFAVPRNVVLNDLDETVETAFKAACKTLEAAGARVMLLDIPEFDALPALNANGSFTAAEAWAYHRHYIAERADEYDPRVVSRIALGEKMSAAHLLDLIAARQDWIDAAEKRIDAFDGLLMPTVPQVAPSIQALIDDEALYFRTNGLMLRNPTFINFLDGCALSLPCHAPGTAPVGLMLAAAGGKDHQVLSIGLAIEAALRP
ncbi:amidase [Pseudomonas matsuisoli]|uniref:Amidase n=1 Tax=Pseudomonas matsuisoli TaxID=1515666 RepID=A0A917PXZ5_9PSED|nr:amidase [Pseudomonas matsuisoli]GGJ98280.1 amidase [Pseudomonas matsuisoli]